MRAWFGNVMAAGGSVGASWGGAVWYWRANNVAPGTGDLTLFLLVVPLALLALLWGGRKLYQRASASPATPAPAEAPVAAAVPAAPAAFLNIVTASVLSPHGGSVIELQQALAGGEARPALDAELVDDYGYPVLAARVTTIDESAARSQLASRDVGFGPEQWRALAAGDAVVTDIALRLAAHPDIDAHNARPDKRAPSPLPVLQLHCAWPADWGPEARALASGWFAERINAAGWPADRLAIAPDRGAADDVATILARLLAASGQPALSAVVACGSHVGAGEIERLSNADALFSARHQQGIIPGEGAAALLLADPAQAALLAFDEAPLPALRSVSSGQRAESADQSRRTDAATLQALCTQALDRAHCQANEVTFVAADADHRTSRVMELMGVVAPQLDATADVASIGAACGACDPVTFLTAVALASHVAQERAAPVLCIGNLDPYRRDVAVITAGTTPGANA
ncbi:hypothetical protein IP91_00273 [Pseudoduganella lurida]|uniref:3-oxoacyl-ACP synthase n=1 Tax=Pseudoduganella lurida TaxID=1036180 RepID=A0A562RJF7_9BURK|nr:hypothetical protein [Pseudoduganella lurida]TWI69207.1 hypothetical protein IP91_00273 [Pseudoduganella lurida]